MNSRPFHITISLEKPNRIFRIGETVKGILKIKTLYKVGIESLGIQTELWTKSEFTSPKKVMHRQELLSDKVLNTDEELQLPFSFEVKSPITYEGLWVDLFWKMTTYVELSNESNKHVRLKSLGKFNFISAAKPTSELNKGFFFRVVSNGSKYHIDEIRDSFTFTPNIPAYLAAIGTCLLLTLGAFVGNWQIFIGVLGGGLVGVGLLIFTIHLLLSPLKFLIKSEAGEIIVELKKTKLTNLFSERILNYVVSEYSKIDRVRLGNDRLNIFYENYSFP